MSSICSPRLLFKYNETYIVILCCSSDYGREIQGVFDVMVEDGYDKTQNLTYGRFVLVNFVYEFTAFCTSIVSQNVNGARARI